MSRSLYVIGAWVAMLFVVFAGTFETPQPQPAVRAPVAAQVADPVTAAMDDLAAWPAAARH
jgi:hypothetical protein